MQSRCYCFATELWRTASGRRAIERTKHPSSCPNGLMPTASDSCFLIALLIPRCRDRDPGGPIHEAPHEVPVHGHFSAPMDDTSSRSASALLRCASHNYLKRRKLASWTLPAARRRGVPRGGRWTSQSREDARELPPTCMSSHSQGHERAVIRRRIDRRIDVDDVHNAERNASAVEDAATQSCDSHYQNCGSHITGHALEALTRSSTL